ARAAGAVVGCQHQSAGLRRFLGASRASKTEYLRPDGPGDRLNLRIEGECVGDGVARLQPWRDQREREQRAAVGQQHTSENPAEDLLEHGVLPWDGVPYANSG